MLKAMRLMQEPPARFAQTCNIQHRLRAEPYQPGEKLRLTIGCSIKAGKRIEMCGRRLGFVARQATPYHPVNARDTLARQAHLNLIAWRDIELLPAADRAKVHPTHRFVIQLHRLKLRHYGNLAAAPGSKADMGYLGNLFSGRVFPGHDPVTLAGPPALARRLFRRADHHPVGDKGQRGGEPAGADGFDFIGIFHRQAKTRTGVKPGFAQQL